MSYLNRAYLAQITLLVFGVLTSFMKESVGLIIVAMAILLLGLIQLVCYMNKNK